MPYSKSSKRAAAIRASQGSKTKRPGTDSATAKQRALIARLDPQIPTGSMTSGEASQIIAWLLKR